MQLMSHDTDLDERMNTFFRSHGDELFHWARGRCRSDRDAQDVVQDSCLKIVKLWRSKPEMTESDAKAIIFHRIRLRAIDIGRKITREQQTFVGSCSDPTSLHNPLELVESETPLPGELLSRIESMALLRQAASSIENPKHRQVMERFCTIPIPTLAEIASALGITVCNVKKRIERAKESFMKALLRLANEQNLDINDFLS
jgi:RNA polymerase sigma factor (sigma-70 family)